MLQHDFDSKKSAKKTIQKKPLKETINHSLKKKRKEETSQTKKKGIQLKKKQSVRAVVAYPDGARDLSRRDEGPLGGVIPAEDTAAVPAVVPAVGEGEELSALVALDGVLVLLPVIHTVHTVACSHRPKFVFYLVVF